MAHADVSLWSVLKQCIGKELTKIAMPVSFNEPLSFLQRLAEYMEYSHLLDKASRSVDAVQRMQVKCHWWAFASLAPHPKFRLTTF